MRTITKEVFTFDELSDEAKQNDLIINLTNKIMTTKNWFKKNQRNEDGKTQYFASVMRDGANFYSYGHHYPLAIYDKQNDVYYVNDAGYSPTTAKHIHWIKSALGFCYFLYDYSFGDSEDKESLGYSGARLTSTDITKIKKCIVNEINYLKGALKTLSPRAFRQKEEMEARIERLSEGL